MQFTKLISYQQEFSIAKSINSFFKEFTIHRILNKSKIRKLRGTPVKDIIISIMQLPFIQKNFYQGIVKNEGLGFNKSSAYDLMNNSKYNWRMFLYNIVVVIINNFIKPLTSEDRDEVLILDDTGYPRNRSKKVELLARCYDHAKMLYFRGFRILQLGWSDGNSFIPIDFTLLSSSKKSNRYQEANDKIDKRCCGAKRRKEAVCKSTELIVPMLKRAFAKGIKAKYLLMDSWFGLPAIILSAKEYIDVICMVKNTPKVFYYKDGKSLTLNNIYKGFRKRRGKANIKGSQTVEIVSGEKRIEVKIVFVRNRNKKRSWLAILSTNTSLPDEEIVRIYGKRWDIEVFFKMTKHCLNLCNEVELRSFDGMIAHITIVFLRYIFLAVEQRKSVDDKSFGGVFLEQIDEMKDLTIAEALLRILSMVYEEMKNFTDACNEYLDELTDIFMGIVKKLFVFRESIN